MRFHAIYPSVKCFHADQGTNIRGCANLLRQMDEEWKSQLMETSASKSLEWKWSPPHSGQVSSPSCFTRCFGDEEMATARESDVGHTVNNNADTRFQKLRHRGLAHEEERKQHRELLLGLVWSVTSRFGHAKLLSRQ